MDQATSMGLQPAAPSCAFFHGLKSQITAGQVQLLSDWSHVISMSPSDSASKHANFYSSQLGVCRLLCAGSACSACSHLKAQFFRDLRMEGTSGTGTSEVPVR